jgi:hypothetical protein
LIGASEGVSIAANALPGAGHEPEAMNLIRVRCDKGLYEE